MRNLGFSSIATKLWSRDVMRLLAIPWLRLVFCFLRLVLTREMVCGGAIGYMPRYSDKELDTVSRYVDCWAVKNCRGVESHPYDFWLTSSFVM